MKKDIKKKEIKPVRLGQLTSLKILKVLPIIILVLGDALLFEKSSDWRTFPILLLYIFSIIRFKFKANATFFICLLLFVLIYIHYSFSSPKTYESQYPVIPFGEKLAVWLYLFLVIGVVQKWREK